MKYPDSVVLIFTKAPVSGQVNTRLIPVIGQEKATRLQQDLIHHRLLQITEPKLCRVVLYCLPDTRNHFFQQCAEQYSVELKNQTGNDLGERMANAIDEQSTVSANVVLIGTDAPALDCNQVETAIETLRSGKDVVIVPAEDGGYVLIGMKQCYRALFLTVPWGTERVLIKTRANAIAIGLKMVELDQCWDIDRPEDYYRWLSMSEGR